MMIFPTDISLDLKCVYALEIISCDINRNVCIHIYSQHKCIEKMRQKLKQKKNSPFLAAFNQCHAISHLFYFQFLLYSFFLFSFQQFRREV